MAPRQPTGRAVGRSFAAVRLRSERNPALAVYALVCLPLGNKPLGNESGNSQSISARAPWGRALECPPDA